jgi:hypothetical protein
MSDSKPVKREVNGTLIPPPLVFLGMVLHKGRSNSQIGLKIVDCRTLDEAMRLSDANFVYTVSTARVGDAAAEAAMMNHHLHHHHPSSTRG